MGVEIGNFTKIPRRFFRSGTALRIGSTASLLYLALCEHANAEGENTFSVSDKALASDTGLSPRTISDARKGLLEEKLIACTRERGRSYRYTLSKLSLEWVPIKDRPRLKRKPRALHATRDQSEEALPKTHSTIRGSQKKDERLSVIPEGTSAKFAVPQGVADTKSSVNFAELW